MLEQPLVTHPPEKIFKKVLEPNQNENEECRYNVKTKYYLETI